MGRSASTSKATATGRMWLLFGINASPYPLWQGTHLTSGTLTWEKLVESCEQWKARDYNAMAEAEARLIQETIDRYWR